MRSSDVVRDRENRHRMEAERQVFGDRELQRDNQSLYRVLSELPSKIRSIPADAWNPISSDALPSIPRTYPFRRTVFTPASGFELPLSQVTIFANRYAFKHDFNPSANRERLPQYRYEVGVSFNDAVDDVLTCTGEVAEKIFLKIESHRTRRITRDLAGRLNSWQQAFNDRETGISVEISAARGILRRYHGETEVLFNRGDTERVWPKSQAGWLVVDGIAGAHASDTEFKRLGFPDIIEQILWAPTKDQAAAFVNRRVLDSVGHFAPPVNLYQGKYWIDIPDTLSIRMEPFSIERTARLYSLIGLDKPIIDLDN